MKDIISWDIPKDFNVPSDYNAIKKGVIYNDSINIEYEIEGLTYRAEVLLPVNYDSTKQYPSIYLLSGIGANREWMNSGHINRVIANLGTKIIDQIIVMPEIMSNPLSSDLRQKIHDFRSLDKKLPFLMEKIEATYNVIKDRKQRTIAGLSMGGMTALYLAYKFDHKEYAFSTVCSISPSTTLFEWLDNKESLPFDQSHNYNFCLGTGTADGLLFDGFKKYRRVLKECGFDNSYITIEGKEHAWDAFSPIFYAFLCHFFKNEEE